MWHGCRIGLLAAALALGFAAPASATTAVSLSGATLEVASGDEGNDVAITVVGADLRVADGSTTVSPGSGCADDGPNAATCPLAGVTLLHVVLNGAIDSLTIAPAITIDASVSGGFGGDTLKGGGGDDTLDGGNDNDDLYGYGGADTIVGGPDTDYADYRDRTAGQNVTVTLNAGSHDDGAAGEGDDVQTENVLGGAGNDLLTGDAGPNVLNGQEGADTIHGGDGGDTLDGGFNFNDADHLFGEGGGDVLEGWAGNDELVGGDGNDVLRGREGDDTLTGGPGNDELRGHEGHNDLSGGDGNDFLAPGGGGGLADGGPGSDQADLQEAGGMTLTLDGVANDTGAGGTYNVENIERLDMGFSPDTVTGSSADEVINGNGGDDTLHGAGGDDVINGGQNADLIDGGPGYDFAAFNVWSSNNCQISLDDVANDGGNGGAEGDDVVQSEGVIGCGDGGTITGDAGPNVLIAAGGHGTLNGGEGDDRLEGGGGDETLNGGGGDDRLLGGDGTDTLHGDGGDDRLDGGNGADLLDGGAGSDLTDYSTAFTPLTITLDGAANDPAGDNVQTEAVRGGQAADTITGGPNADLLSGGPGADQLRGGGGDDVLAGDGGADLLDGQGGEDTADYSGAGGPVTVRLDGAADDGYAGEGDDAQVEDVVGGDFADVLVGDGEANLLAGGGGADQVDGAGGDDTIVGGPGADTLATGAGTDTVRAVDGEADAVSCDVPSGKTVEADGLDTVSNCGATATGGAAVLPGGEVPAPPAGPEAALSFAFPAPVGAPAAAVPAAVLARALDGAPAKGATLLLARRATVIDLGDLACAEGLACAVRVVVRALAGRHKVLAQGTDSASGGSASAQAGLTRAGRAALRRGKKVKVIATFTLTQAGTRATKSLAFAIRRVP